MTAGKLGNRILAALLILSIVPFAALSYLSVSDIRSMQEATKLHTEEMTAASESGSLKAIEDIGKAAIRQKAEDVSRQAEIYMESHPWMGVSGLQSDPAFQEIAVQPVGKTGYTAVTDYRTLICRFHKDPKIVNLDLSSLADKLPGFWEIMSRTRGGFPAEGFYDWEDPDGTVRSKYMHISIINATTADGVGMHVAATTYIDEFSAPVAQLEESMNAQRSSLLSENERILSETQSQLLAAFLVSMSAIVAIAILVTRSVVRPIDLMTGIVKEISGGKLDVKLEMRSYEEMNDLVQSFNAMVGELKASRRKIEEHEKEMDETIRQKTGELNEKISETERSRTAILNMMEDSEEANRHLKKAQEELKRAVSELKEMDVKKDEFISVTAHEFKTPLTAIHGFAELLQNGKTDGKSRQRYLQIMIEETRRLARLVTDILDLSRMDLGTFKFSFEEADIRKIIEDIKSEISIPAERKGLKASYSVDSAVPKKIVTDQERLRQVLINLLTNAVKYTPKGSVFLSVAKERSAVKFSVRDTGIGIAKEHIPKLFRRFYQIDSSYTRAEKGSGLGLAVCRELLNGMGGDIWVESEVGKGSIFHFTLPLKARINTASNNRINRA